ncbi:MAG: hypothetical protein P8X90_35945 [Desulfobacterales bacterium]
MIKFGPPPEEMRAISIDDIFLSRLKLIIIMAKAYLKGYPIGKYRKFAIIKNAHHVFYHSLQSISQINFSENFQSESQSTTTSEIDIEEERKFHQRVQLLAVMVKAAAIDGICDTLIFTFNIKEFEFLKVA